MRVSAFARVSAVVVVGTVVASGASAHPGSGIVVDEKGQVFFTDTGHPDDGFSGHVWKIDAHGRLSAAHATGAHWLALDATGRFARADLKAWFDRRLTPNFECIPRTDADPTLLQTDGVPFVVHRDGNLYYANRHVEVMRLSPDGTRTPLVPNLRESAERLGGIKGLAAGPDGSLFVAYPRAVQRISLAGAVTTVADAVTAPDCDRDVPADVPEPYLRGLAVDERGTVYAAATGCRCVVRIAHGGKVETVLKAERPWSPTGVAVSGEDVYVLEYTNVNGKPAEWRPRVRQLGRNGTVTTLATIAREVRPPLP